MYDVDFIKEKLKKIGEFNIERKIVNVPKFYPHLLEEFTETYIDIDNVTSFTAIDEIIENTGKDLEEHGLFCIASAEHGGLICLGLLEGNKNQIFYMDYDFGLFKLDKSIEEFIEKLDTPIDYDSLSEEEWEQIGNNTYRL